MIKKEENQSEMNDKSENLVKKSKKLNLKISFLNQKTENKKWKIFKKTIFFIKPKNFRKEIDIKK